MSKAKIYKIERKNKNKNDNDINIDLLQIIVGVIVYALVLYITQGIFEKLYIKNFMYSIIAALILSILNYTVKLLLIYWTLPLNILTYGIAYPIVNMIILKLCDVLMGSAFEISGIFSMFIIAIFISVMRIIFDNIITNNIGRR